MEGKKLATLFSAIALGFNVLLSVPTALASEVDAVLSSQVEKEEIKSYFRIAYDGKNQVIALGEGVDLHLLNWKDEEQDTVVARVKLVTVDGLTSERDLELRVTNELVEVEMNQGEFSYISLAYGDVFSVKEVESTATVEAFMPVELNENGSSKEQLAIVDQEGTILDWKETFQFLNGERAVIKEEDYIALNVPTVVKAESDTNVEKGAVGTVEDPVVEEKAAETVEPEPKFRTFALAPSIAVSPSVVYSTHVQSFGWLNDVKNGATSGTMGESKRIEAIKLQITDLKDLGIEYATHVQSIGWTGFVGNGQVSGTEKQAKRVEAFKVRLTGTQAANYDVYYRIHAETFGWLDWAKNGEPAGTEGMSKRLEAIEVKLVKKGAPAPGSTSNTFVQRPVIGYTSYVREIGWQNQVSDSQLSGTSGQRKSLEAIQIGFNSISGLDVRYQTHLQSNGWLNWVSGNTISGLPGSGKRMEALRIELTGTNAKHYDVYYRVHVQNVGWLGWAKNGEPAGSEGYGYQAEAYEVKVVPVGTAISRNGLAFRERDKTSIVYTPHVQTLGWLSPSQDGATSGTYGKALRLEALTVSLNHDRFTGGVSYRSHVQSFGWMNPVQDGAITGTTGSSKRVEAIQLNLTGEIANHYDIYYRTHIESFGWLGWAKNGMSSGSEGMSKRIESIEIKLIEKGLPAPVVFENDAFKTVDKDIVFLDIGHGGSDPGAQYYGVQEKKLNLEIGLKVQRDLEAAGYTVIMSRTDDTYMDYRTERSRVANESGADIFISLHNNAMPGNAYVNGIETFYYEYDPDYQPKINMAMHNDPERIIKSAVLANAIHKSLIDNTGAYDRGVRRDTFAVLRETALPAVLVEFGFMSNLTELNKLQSQEYQLKLSEAVLRGVKGYFRTY